MEIKPRCAALEKPASRPLSFSERLAGALAQTIAIDSPGASPPAECLLLDLSGSMWSDAGTGRTRLEELAAVVANLPPIRRFGFSGECQEIQPHVDIVKCALSETYGGGTDMAGAFAELKRLGIKSAAMITDGKPDSASAALTESLSLLLHIFYVGPEPVPRFLKDLAAKTGGQFHRGQFTMKTALETKIRRLLAGPAKEVAKL